MKKKILVYHNLDKKGHSLHIGSCQRRDQNDPWKKLFPHRFLKAGSEASPSGMQFRIIRTLSRQLIIVSESIYFADYNTNGNIIPWNNAGAGFGCGYIATNLMSERTGFIRKY